MALPKTQKAILHNLATNTLSLTPSSPILTPNFSLRQHLIRVHTTSPCNNELTWPINFPHLMDADRIPIPCNDFAGTVILAPSDSPFQAGTPVFGRTSASRTGDARPYTIALESELARKPEGLGWEEACAVPLSSETAWQCLFNRGGLEEPGSEGVKQNEGKRVLVTGASGSVGTWVVQLAKVAGVGGVVGVAGTSNVEFVKSLGADEIVDYKTTNLADWGERERGKYKADLVIDCVGGKTLEACWSCVKDEGVLLSVNSAPEQHKPAESKINATNFFFVMISNGKQLDKIANLVVHEKCKPFVDSVFSFEDFQTAFDRVERKSGLKGKVIIKVEE